jgi:hypothetical protein
MKGVPVSQEAMGSSALSFLVIPEGNVKYLLFPILFPQHPRIKTKANSIFILF